MPQFSTRDSRVRPLTRSARWAMAEHTISLPRPIVNVCRSQYTVIVNSCIFGRVLYLYAISDCSEQGVAVEKESQFRSVLTSEAAHLSFEIVKNCSTHHSMSRELGICTQDTVSRRVVTRSVHSIRASLVKRCLRRNVSPRYQKPRIAFAHTGNRTSLVSTPVIVTMVEMLW